MYVLPYSAHRKPGDVTGSDEEVDGCGGRSDEDGDGTDGGAGGDRAVLGCGAVGRIHKTKACAYTCKS